MILHLTMQEKFIKPFIDFTDDNFDIKEHFFLLVGGDNKFAIEDNAYTKSLQNKKDFLQYFLEFNKKMYTADKIILHGLFQPYNVIYLFFNPWLLQKCYWIIWGGELYSFETPKVSLTSKIYEFMKAVCIKNFAGVIAYATGDFDRAKEWYGAQGTFYKSLYYPYLAVENYLQHIKVSTQEENIIMVGNSATKTNEHLEIFERLSMIKGIENYQIIVPLSYGDMDYAQEVIKKGELCFGSKFNPLTDFMSSDAYYNLLCRVKIVIMGHKRQQATGNILALVKFGKKVFIRTNISTWDFYAENGIKMFKYEEMEEELLTPMLQKDKNENLQSIQKRFTYKRVIQEWHGIYSA